MRKTYLFTLLTVACILCSISLYAHDFEVDGIYYNITSASDLTVEVTYKGKYVSTDDYSGHVAIPETVTYNRTTYSVTSIGKETFAYSDLTSVTIPEGVTSIEKNAFSKCTGLTSVTIPEGIASIGSWAFYGCSGLTSVFFNAENCTTMGNAGVHVFDDCTNLTSITIGNNVKKIPDYAFYSCTGLASITIPNSVTSIGNSAFDNCTSLKELRIEDGKSTLSVGYNKYNSSGTGEGLFYDCPLETLYLGRNIRYTEYASYYQSYPKRYGYSAFYNNTTLKSLTIGNCVTSIGNSAFDNCTSLKEVRIEDGESTLSVGYKYNSSGTGKGLFYDCPLETLYLGRNLSYDTDNGNSPFTEKTELQSVTIGNSVTSINAAAFAYCSGLTSITIPRSVTSIGNLIFVGCSSLESIIVESGNAIYDSRNNCNAIIETLTNTLKTGCKNTTIPNSVTNIGNHALAYCSGLTSITIPNSVINIGDSAFKGCTRLTSVTIPEGVYGIGNSAFEDCKGLTNVNISDIEAWCKINFSSYTSNPIYYAKSLNLNGQLLNNLEIPESITEIKNYSFSNCYSLESVTIPEGIRIIGNYAFSSCLSIRSLTIPKSITKIGDAAFSGCLTLKSLIFNAENCTKLGGDEDAAFDDCISLTSITIGDNVKIIPDYAFRGCSGLTNIIIPNSVTSIGRNAFYKCTGLTEITIPEGVTSIATSTFGYCKGLTNVIIPESVTKIGNSAFEYCSGLTSITIPNSVTSINKYAFYECTNLTEITLGSSVKEIGEDAFSGADRLEIIYSLNPIPPTCTNEDVFYKVNKSKCKVYVPIGAGVYYQISLVWRDFYNIVEKEMLGVESPLANNNVNVVVENGNIVVNSADNANVEVYSTNGQCVYNGSATTIPVNTNGLYIVKVNGKSFKVIL